MTKSLLITESLQHDLAGRIGKSDPLPNRLHIGYHEALRLNGEDPASSPLNHFIAWAYEQHPDALGIMHIRDWHDANDPAQKLHLEQFGNHDLENTFGAEFIFQIPEAFKDRPVDIINCPGFNDFMGTGLEAKLESYRGQKIKVGLVGVWTNAKISELAYELSTRYPEFDIAVCSALTAGSSRAEHFDALRRIHRLYNVKLMDSVTDLANFLGGKDFQLFPDVQSNLEIVYHGVDLPAEVTSLIQYLFRDCDRIDLRILDGGFSGNFVFSCKSWDKAGREQAPHVLKIGPRSLIAQERAAFEEVELILGNNAPRVVDFADFGKYGAIKYRYASMDGGATQSFQKIFMNGASLDEISRILDRVFINQLGRLYGASHMEGCNLLEHYGFDINLREVVNKSVANIYGAEATASTLEFFGRTIPNPAHFYNEHMETLKRAIHEQRFFADIHGDLNGANILVDTNKNVWLIDFFYMHYGHVLKDLIKLENDLLYIFTPVSSAKQLRTAMRFTDCLLTVKDLLTPPDFPEDIMNDPHFGRAARTVRMLRAYYPNLLGNDVDPVQAMIGQMRYAMHTLIFDESNIWQKRWALYAAGMLSSAIDERLTSTLKLDIAWIPLPITREGKIGLTILPGRRDRGRDLATDIATMKEQGVQVVYALITDQELQDYGVPQLLDAYAENGIKVRQIRVIDGSHASWRETQVLVEAVDEDLRNGRNVMIHCLGGLGRSGTLVANYLTSIGMTSDEAIAQVREARSPRAVETSRQINFINKYANQFSSAVKPPEQPVVSLEGTSPS